MVSYRLQIRKRVGRGRERERGGREGRERKGRKRETMREKGGERGGRKRE